MQPQAQVHKEPWRARLALKFAARDARSTLVSRCHYGPLRVQRPFYPEGEEVCHAYILHPPGGVVGGDELVIDVTVAAGAHALLTTPAAGKFYRSDAATAQQAQTLRVAENAALEWLPQENILFDGARATLRTHVELSNRARFIGWEIVCLGRRGAGEGFERGALRQQLEIRRDGAPLFIECGCYDQTTAVLAAPWGLAGQAVSGSLLCVCEDAGLIELVRAAASPHGGSFSVTQLDGVMVCRYLGDHADEARQCFEHAWGILRPRVFNRPACAPRVWAT